MPNETPGDLNPYRSPSVEASDLVAVGSTAIEGLTVALVKRREVYRCVRLSGVLEAKIEWNGDWPNEYIREDGPSYRSLHFHMCLSSPSSWSHRLVTSFMRSSTFACGHVSSRSQSAHSVSL